LLEDVTRAATTPPRRRVQREFAPSKARVSPFKTDDEKKTYEAVSCIAFKQLHWVNPKAGKILAHK